MPPKNKTAFPDPNTALAEDYAWTRTPFVSSAPMRILAGPTLAHAVSSAGGLGFIGVGSDVSNLKDIYHEAERLQTAAPVDKCPKDILPVGFGFINWGADLDAVSSIFSEATLKPAAVWFFAPRNEHDLVEWTDKVRRATNNKSKIWIQVGTVKSALELSTTCKPNVLVIQGADAGGHGLAQSSSIISLLPEAYDALAAQRNETESGREIPLIATGGIMDGRGVAAALMLGAAGVCLGTRFLVSEEAEITQGYKNAVVAAEDGGVTTVRTKVYDTLRGTTSWPDHYNGRGIINKSYRDWTNGMPDEENIRLYEEAVKLGDSGWGTDEGRMTTYAGTGVGLAKKIQPADKIVEEVIKQTKAILARN